MQEYYSDDSVDNDNEYGHYEKMLKLLKDGAFKVYHSRGYHCPFDVKVLDTSYKSLLQHADVSSHSTSRIDRAQHKALAEYLRNLPLAPKEAAKADGAELSKKDMKAKHVPIDF